MSVKLVPLTVPDIGADEEAAVLEVLRSGMLVQGANVAAFEQAVAERAGRAFGVAVSSGTAALSLSLEAAGVGPGDEVLVPALSWPSPAHAVACVGAKVVLVDVDPDQWNASADALAAARTDKTKAAIVIDQFGNPVDAPAIEASLAGLILIEDAACAMGSHYADGRPCGALGAMACFSFHPRKVLTTGEGGVIVTNDPEADTRLRVLRNHGQRSPGVFVEPALNFRLGELGGAMGRVQMGRLDALLEARVRIARQIQGALSDVLTFQAAIPGSAPNHQTLGALLPEGVDRSSFIERARDAGVQVGALSYDLSQIGTLSAAPTPIAARIVHRGIALPLYPSMSDADIAQVVNGICAALAA